VPNAATAGASFDEAAALEQAATVDCGKDRHPQPGQGAADQRLLAAAFVGLEPADDGAAGHGDQRVAGVDRRGDVRRKVALQRNDLDALGLQRRDQAAMLGVHQIQVGGGAVLPVPEAVRVDQRRGVVAPAVRPDGRKLAARGAHQHRPQPADLVVSTPPPPPHPLLLARVGEGRAVIAAQQRQVEARRIGAAHAPTLPC
jgi:hypothetical protein